MSSIRARIITPSASYKEKQVQIYDTQVLQPEAKLAFALLEKWGPVCMTSDGEDSTGRAKGRPLTPEETVDRAFEISELAYDEARRRGLILSLPDMENINPPEQRD